MRCTGDVHEIYMRRTGDVHETYTRCTLDLHETYVHIEERSCMYGRHTLPYLSHRGHTHSPPPGRSKL